MAAGRTSHGAGRVGLCKNFAYMTVGLGMAVMAVMGVEAVFFALAMSLDGMFGGLGAGFTGKNIFFTVMGSFVVSFCAVLCGCRIGMQASKRWKTDVSWLGGVLFVILAFQKII